MDGTWRVKEQSGEPAIQKVFEKGKKAGEPLFQEKRVIAMIVNNRKEESVFRTAKLGDRVRAGGNGQCDPGG